MTKKDYIKIAKIIKDNTLLKDEDDRMLSSVNKACLVFDLCVMFKADNNLFSNDRFISACDVVDD